jgi:glucan phosphorylase
VRSETVFTTHTPVRAGNEEHSIADLRRMGACLQLSVARSAPSAATRST